MSDYERQRDEKGRQLVSRSRGGGIKGATSLSLALLVVKLLMVAVAQENKLAQRLMHHVNVSAPCQGYDHL